MGNFDQLEVEYIRGSDWGGGVGGLLYSLRSGGPSYNHYNSRGDVTGQTDASGSLTYQAAYEAFGRHGDTASSQEWGSSADRQRANTKDEDPTGLLNEGFRYRDLDVGAFITRDPLGFVDGPNLYTYVVQNPWTYYDPLGLKIEYVEQPSEVAIPDVSGKALDSPGFTESAKQWVRNIKEMDPRLHMMVSDLEESARTHYIVPTKSGSSVISYNINAEERGERSHTIVYINADQLISGEKVPAEVIVGHELQHAWDRDDIRIGEGEGLLSGRNPVSGVLRAEERAVRTENIIRNYYKIDVRKKYQGNVVENYGPDHSPLTEEFNERRKDK